MVLGSKKLGHLITKFDRGGDDRGEESPRRLRKGLTPRSKKKLVNVDELQIGDKINLRETPWKDCEGMYPCKVVRRPDFAESALVLYAGAAGARAVAQSSKQHLMIVDRYLVELTLLNDDVSGRVAFVSSIDGICKMRHRQEEELIAIFFKSSVNDPFIFKFRESSIVSQQIRAARGSGLAKKEAINKALHLIQEIQAQERALEYEPTLKRVNQIEELYDKAVQQFLIAEDGRHEEVTEHKMTFLALPKVASIRKGTPQKPKMQRQREPQILETFMNDANFDIFHRDDGDEASQNWANFGDVDCQVPESKKKESNRAVDDMVFEARQDFDAFNLGNELDENIDRDGELPDFAEFDAMLAAAERELDEIRKM